MGRDFSHNCILKQKLRRLEIRSMFPPKSPFRALFGAFYPHPAHQSAPRAEWATHFLAPGQRGCSTVPLPGHCSPASRPTPHQRGEVLCRLSPAGYCLPPTAQLPITERGPISTSEPSISLCAEPGDSCGQHHRPGKRHITTPCRAWGDLGYVAVVVDELDANR